LTTHRRHALRELLALRHELERIFPSPPDASDAEFDDAVLVDELLASLAVLTPRAASTGAINDGIATARQLLERRGKQPLDPAAERTLGALLDRLLNWPP
jgi:hypothetical protein